MKERHNNLFQFVIGAFQTLPRCDAGGSPAKLCGAPPHLKLGMARVAASGFAVCTHDTCGLGPAPLPPDKGLRLHKELSVLATCATASEEADLGADLVGRLPCSKGESP